MSIPDNLVEKADSVHRGSIYKIMPIESVITLRKGTRSIDIFTKIDNPCKQHRERACFPTNLAAKISSTEVSFDVIEREITLSPGSPYYGKENLFYGFERWKNGTGDTE